MKLYYNEVSNNARKACAVAKYVSAPVEFVRIDFAKQENKTPEFLALNPNGKLPTLEDGGKTLWESNAIMCHLAEKAGSSLWPSDSATQIDIIRWFCWETGHFNRHAGTLFFQNVLKAQFGMGEPDAAAVEEATGFFKQFAGVLDGHLKGRSYLVGNTLSVADFAVASMLPIAELAKLPLQGCDEIARWHGALNELPAWREPFPAPAASAA